MRPINLLPPEAFEKSKARRALLLALAAGAVYLVLLGIVTVFWQGRVNAKQDEIVAREERVAELRQQLNQLADVQELLNEYDGGIGLFTTALATDVAWGRILNDIGRIIPDRVWLDSMAGAVNPDPQTGGLGTLTVTGFGFDFPDVSAWLRSLDSDRFPALGGAWVQSVSASEIGEVPVVTFNSTASLTAASLSQRIAERIPRIGE